MWLQFSWLRSLDQVWAECQNPFKKEKKKQEQEQAQKEKEGGADLLSGLQSHLEKSQF